MRSILRTLAVAALAAPLFATAQIANTKHDLASGSTAAVRSAATGGTDQTCIFCHTPHVARMQDLIWNHADSTNATIGWAGTQTTATGTSLPAAITALSKQCLSCHDGSVSIGQVNNAGGGATGTIAMLTVASHTDATGKMIYTGTLVGSAGVMGSATAGNHPVSIPYPYTTKGGGSYNGIISRAVGDGLAGNYYAASSTSCASSSGYCTAAATNGTYVNLYQGTSGAITLNTLGVECGTCHEPHNKYGTNSFFLRVSQAQSAICKACHNK